MNEYHLNMPDGRTLVLKTPKGLKFTGKALQHYQEALNQAREGFILTLPPNVKHEIITPNSKTMPPPKPRPQPKLRPQAEEARAVGKVFSKVCHPVIIEEEPKPRDFLQEWESWEDRPLWDILLIGWVDWWCNRIDEFYSRGEEEAVKDALDSFHRPKEKGMSEVERDALAYQENNLSYDERILRSSP